MLFRDCSSTPPLSLCLCCVVCSMMFMCLFKHVFLNLPSFALLRLYCMFYDIHVFICFKRFSHPRFQTLLIPTTRHGCPVLLLLLIVLLVLSLLLLVVVVVIGLEADLAALLRVLVDGGLRALYYTILYYTILYYTILYYTILYYTILYYTILYYTTLCHAILYYTILYYTILYYTILYYTILYYTILYYTSVLVDGGLRGGIGGA